MHYIKRVMSLLLIASLIAPNTSPLVVYASEAINNIPRYVDFSRPKAITLQDLGLEEPKMTTGRRRSRRREF